MEESIPFSKLAEQILQLEVKLDIHCDIHTIQRLNELYGICIDLYMDKQPAKARHFQRKVCQLLHKPNILSTLQYYSTKQKEQALKGSKSSKLIRFQETQKEDEQLKEQIREFVERQSLKKKMFEDQSKAEYQMEELIKQSKRAASKQAHLKTQDLTKQQENLNGRILKRAKSQQQRFKSCKKLTY